MALPRGFKTEAERLSGEIRADLRLCLQDRLDCALLAEHLAIPLVSLTELQADGAKAESVRRLMRSTFNFSALTLCVSDRRLIVYNPSHPTGRQANSVAHELSHVVLEHPAVPPLDSSGCRRWDQDLEDQADWQAATLLVPRDGALYVMRQGMGFAKAADHFGVSEVLFKWRAQQTGVIRQLSAAARWR